MTEFFLQPNGNKSREEALLQEGWVRQFTANEPRLSESVEQYEAMGFEVLLEDDDLSARSCSVCFTENPGLCKTIYTRPRPNAEDRLAELF